ncbi:MULTISPECIES: hypothetical protein [unclassified Leucobacter]|uniref:hypothetical protein n=1 Tax=unclassified Leucobacter TaxID=2621730 RepID=UPI00165D5A83|nr:MULTISPECIES: hypothetical protein [unclassified Leucobacter]MBC9936756.1 hypothetical protein [Leucobacter sp. cx-87]
MKIARVGAALVALLVLSGCAAAGEVMPTPSQSAAPTQTPEVPETTALPVPEGWTQLDFGYGFASVLAPMESAVELQDLATPGTAQRFGGGYTIITQDEQTKIHFLLMSAANAATVQSGPPCGDVLVETLPGAAGIPVPHNLYLVTSALGTQFQPSVLAMLSTTPPVGEKCGPGAQITVPEGGFISGFAWADLPVGATMDDALAWIDSPAGQEAIRIVQSVQVK